MMAITNENQHPPPARYDHQAKECARCQDTKLMRRRHKATDEPWICGVYSETGVWIATAHETAAPGAAVVEQLRELEQAAGHAGAGGNGSAPPADDARELERLRAELRACDERLLGYLAVLQELKRILDDAISGERR